jgi:hypothetical protein
MAPLALAAEGSVPMHVRAARLKQTIVIVRCSLETFQPVEV